MGSIPNNRSTLHNHRLRTDSSFKVSKFKPSTSKSMGGSRNFRRGGGGGGGGVQISLTKKALTTFFFVLSLFHRSQMVNFKEIFYFHRFQRGSNIFQGGGGSKFFQRGSNCLFPIQTHITCGFPGGGSGPPVPPSGSALEEYRG